MIENNEYDVYFVRETHLRKDCKDSRWVDSSLTLTLSHFIMINSMFELLNIANYRFNLIKLNSYMIL